MKLDFGKIGSGQSVKTQINPRKIFTTLKRDTTKFKRPSDEQGDVLDEWFGKRNNSDNTIKMNTGSGKTIVGLLCLQSSLNENVGPAVYITPDNYLLHQVVKEAQDLGVPVTEDVEDPEFLASSKVLVININKLVNGRSVFGVGNAGVKIKIGSLVIDDAHACLSIVADQFKIALESDHDAYAPLLELFSDSLKNQSEANYLDVKAEDPQALMPVPFWAWKDNHENVLGILHPHRHDETLKWPWNLLKDVLAQCQCVFGGGKLEISPRFIPIDNIPAFTDAKRRIYMTATLADDGILVSHFQADPEKIRNPIRPKGGGDIGDRMILAPQEISPEITVEEIKDLAVKLAKTMNVAVIVPSKKRSDYWLEEADQILTAADIEAGTEKLRAGHVGLTVFVNKYDGVDLPGAACRLLIVDGLPEVSGLIERVEQSIMDGTPKQLIRQIQRIEQGMGRGVRSSEDYCVVLLLGGLLTKRLHQPEAQEMFSTATQAQLALGRDVTDQLQGGKLLEIEDAMKLCFTRDDDWVSASRSAVVNAEEGDASHIEESIIHLRQAFDDARLEQFPDARDKVQKAVQLATEKKAKGYLKQQLAEYVHHIDPRSAQEIQLSAVKLNRAVVRPIRGIVYSKLTTPADSQAIGAANFMKRFLESNDLLIWVNALIEELEWGEAKSKRFERAICDLGKFLGFGSDQPEDEVGKGPDNLWALGSLKYLVIECKSGCTKAKLISKHDCNQLNGSMVWFEENYDDSCTATPIMIHPKIIPEHAATLTNGTRIIQREKLTDLITALRQYSIAIAQNTDFTDVTKVSEQLSHFCLSRNDFVNKFTVRHRKSK